MADKSSRTSSRLRRSSTSFFCAFAAALAVGYFTNYRHKPLDGDIFGDALAVAIGVTVGFLLYDIVYRGIQRYRES